MHTKQQTQLVISAGSARSGLEFRKAKKRQAAKAVKEALKQDLLTQHDLLEQYARSIDPNAASVKIRLENARKAAEASDSAAYQRLARDIFGTLEERCNEIAAARKKVTGLIGSSSPSSPFASFSGTKSENPQHLI